MLVAEDHQEVSKMNIRCLASSSEGNCYLVEFKSASIIIEAGLPIKECKNKLFFDCKKTLNDIDAVLITHDHKDHSKAANDLKRLGKRVYANKYIADTEYCLESLKMTCIAKDTFVFPFEVEHDAPDSLGFIIKSGDETLLFINDCKYIKYDLSNYKFDVVMIECNYSTKLLHTLIGIANKEDDKLLKFRYKRLLDSHMSSTACLRVLKSLDLSKCNAIFLMHLSDGHSNEVEFKEKFTKELNKKVYICRKYGGFK